MHVRMYAAASAAYCHTTCAVLGYPSKNQFLGMPPPEFWL